MRANCSTLLLTAPLAALLAICGMVPCCVSSVALAQAGPDTISSSVHLPEPIYWKQDLFLVPYQWGSAAEPAAAQAVWLFVSKDRGATWQKISEAKPQVKAFNYRANGEGEYWFAIRTLDHQGRAWPAGPYQPELRVIVDTTMPRIDELRGRLLGNGCVEIAWHGTDTNLDASTWTIEAQTDAAGTWQPVPVDGLNNGQTVWQPPVGGRPLALRATVSDQAGNSATYRAEISVAPATGIAAIEPTMPLRNSTGFAAGRHFSAPSETPGTSNPSGWVANSAASTQIPTAASPTNQSWPANTTSRAPFRLSSTAANAPGDGVTAYGSPPALTAPPASSDFASSNFDENRVEARYAAMGPIVRGSPEPAPSANGDPQFGEIGRSAPNSAQPTNPGFAPLEPFRQASITRLPTPGIDASPPLSIQERQSLLPIGSYAAQNNPSAQTKLVGSRTFALEYDLDDTGRWGVSKVELWGTRDGGRTWRSYARDDDQRSPLVVTVDEEGIYGFRIVVESAGSAAVPPSSGDAPELWVAVDLRRPVIELTAIERGEGNLADHLILRWQAADDNLEPRPISLFFSSRPAGPWSAIATSLADTGEYTWRVERHVPARFYLRAEARDMAGNLAAFQIREPIEFAPSEPGGRLRDAESVTPTAVGVDAAYR